MFAETAPVPPVSLFGGEEGVTGLGDGAAEGVEDAGVLTGVGEVAELAEELIGVGGGELGDGVDLEEGEVGEHGFADAGEVAELAWRLHRASINEESGGGCGKL